jgi:hypothetical protein
VASICRYWSWEQVGNYQSERPPPHPRGPVFTGPGTSPGMSIHATRHAAFRRQPRPHDPPVPPEIVLEEMLCELT